MSDPRYIDGILIDLDDALVERWGFGIAAMEAIGRCLREVDLDAADRWATVGGKVIE